jgi:hypothetical protein
MWNGYSCPSNPCIHSRYCILSASTEARQDTANTAEDKGSKISALKAPFIPLTVSGKVPATLAKGGYT